jgi:O-antigen biosynthesis protein
MLRPFLRKQFDRVKHVWGSGTIWSPGEIRHWLQHPLVQARINSKIVEGFPGDRFQYFLSRYLKDQLPVARAMTLGCGSGELERGLAKYNVATIHDAVDISDFAIAAARDAATSEGLQHLRYGVADLNRIELQPRAYDVIFGVSSIHHVSKLEHLFGEVRSALKPDGYLFLDEYVGPSRFQWTDNQLRIMNEQLDVLPKHLKRSVSQPGKFKRRIIRKSLKYMIEADPSEAVRSAEIVPLVSKYFRVLEVKGYGGSLLHELLFDIAGNFTEQDPDSMVELNRLFRLEDELIAAGQFSHDFAVIIAAV